LSDNLEKPAVEPAQPTQPPSPPHRASWIDTIKWLATAAVLVILGFLIQKLMAH
jgi:hypothetical protein